MSISFFAAFLGGLISLFSPCSALVLPSFLATSFHQRKHLLKATLVFSLGILTVMLPLGLGFYSIVSLLSKYRQTITLVIGLFLIVEGVLQFLGRSSLLPHGLLTQKNKKSFTATYSLGLASGIGSMSCVGPILGAIITLAAYSNNLATALIMILSYTLGLVGPLLLISFYWQKNQSKATKLLKGKVLSINGFKIHAINLISGLTLLLLGFVFIKYQGSLGLIPIFSHSGILNFFFNLQDKLFTF